MYRDTMGAKCDSRERFAATIRNTELALEPLPPCQTFLPACREKQVKAR
jgi:hypothetical protein